MYMNAKPAWDNLSEVQRTAWIENVIKFYPPDSVTPQDAVELARDEYNDSESLLPIEEICEETD
jgi:hypothetical protein